jgi:two-component system response regulator PhoP
MRVLIVEDERTINSQLQQALTAAGYSVDQAYDGSEGYYFGMEYPFDLAVIDLGLPEMDGLTLIRQLRENGRSFPILILTARGQWQEKVQGLEAGADDYVVKPFHLEEVLARLKALLRRAVGIAAPVIRFGAIELDTVKSEIRLDGKPLVLTGYEFRVAEYLMLHAGKVISKTELTEHIYDQDFDRDSNVIEVFVGRLRKKLDPDNRLQPIETLRGRGYRFVLAAE